MLTFEWDNAKATSNFRKHGVSFEEAKAVFLDPDARLIADPDHSNREQRFVLLGMSQKLRILAVCHCYRDSESVIRIISARKAAKSETRMYEDNLP